jgi:hypothetical protein
MRNWDEYRATDARWRGLTPVEIEHLLFGGGDADYDSDGSEEFSWHEIDGLYQSHDYVREDWKIRVTLVDSYGGEGEGDEVAKTIAVAFVDEDGESCATRYLQKPGYHQSYEGTYYDGEIFEVTPVTERVTVWRRK